SDIDYESLKSIIEAYEKLSMLSRDELLKANETILAYEKLISLSREELLQAKEEINKLRHRENILRKEIIAIFKRTAADDSFILEKLKKLSGNKSGFYGEIFYLLTNLNLPEEEAEKYWNEILEHSSELSNRLGRNVSLRVAMLDYLLHKQPVLKSPKFIEIDIFEQIIRNSVVDELTGVFNRRYFNDSLAREIKRCKRYSKPLCLFVFDLDNFKNFNDKYGHVEGDKALQVTAQTLLKNFRTEDIICRIGGEEFSVILPEITLKDTVILCERFVRKLREESQKELAYIVTISGGIGFYPKDGQTPEELYKTTDRYAYIAKNSGKDKIFVSRENSP
ncbi:MAG: GGDEF domain-containing protein, partial [Leptospiraceae bacterium]|nr:GGDEF domain-containing protein [Leptospiraceae bacterium]